MLLLSNMLHYLSLHYRHNGFGFVFSNDFSKFIEIITWFLSFILINIMYYTNCYLNLNQPSSPEYTYSFKQVLFKAVERIIEDGKRNMQFILSLTFDNYPYRIGALWFLYVCVCISKLFLVQPSFSLKNFFLYGYVSKKLP